MKICRGRATVNGMDLEVLKALGDETRYAHVPRAGATSTRRCRPRSSPTRLGLHANTVRLHLERLRDAGLVDVEAIHRGTVGRPQHLYSLAAGAPGLGFDPPAHALLAGLLARAGRARRAPTPTTPTETGRAWGAEPAGATRTPQSCLTRARRTSSTGSASSPPSTEDGDADGAVRDRVPPLPVPGAGRGLPRARVQPAPGDLRRRGRSGRRREAWRSSRRCTTRAVPRRGRGTLNRSAPEARNHES